MQKITAKLAAKRTAFSAEISGNLQVDGVSTQGTVQLMTQFIQIILDNIVEVGGTGQIGFLYEPGLGISIDIRKYNIVTLTSKQQSLIGKQIKVLEDAVIKTQAYEVLPVAIQISLSVT